MRVHVLPLATFIEPSAAVARLRDLPGLCWLDGDRAHPEGRYAFLAVEPTASVRALASDRDPFRALGALEPVAGRDARQEPPLLDGPPPEGSVPRYIGYVAYDACFAGGALRSRRVRAPEQPVLELFRYDHVLCFDLVARRAYALGDTCEGCERLATLLQRAPEPARACHVGPVSWPEPEQHAQAIELALEQIACGNVYQVNLARRLHACFSGDPLALFLALRAASPVPYGFYCEAGEKTIAARTMERFLRWDRERQSLCTQPIKGTVARGQRSDAELQAGLLADPKEHAEHVMIVDLMRNDLSQVAETGSVRVTSPLFVEAYARLLHLVSTVTCRTRPDVTLADVLCATFPPGSVTGAPKRAAIELIDRLESSARGLYTGALGFVDRLGGLSLAVAIRTAVVERGTLEYWTGGGIVSASDKEAELRETVLKAQVLSDALGMLD